MLALSLMLIVGHRLTYAFQLHSTTADNENTFSLTAIQSRDSPSTNNNTTSINVGSNWYIPVSIGTPPQSFFFLGDSGAPGFALASTLLPLDEQPTAPIYNPNISTTAKQRDGYTYFLEYGSLASSSGVVFQDVVTIGNLTVTDMDIEVQTSNNHNQTIQHSPRTGNLGLNFDMSGQTTKPTKLPTWLQRIMPNLQAGVFTVDFNTNTSNGTFDFGYIDNSKYAGDIGYAPVVNGSSEWQIQITGQQLANGTLISTDTFVTTVDTGSGGAGIPRGVANNYFAQVEGAAYDNNRGTFTYPCSSKLPDFTFAIGSFRGTMGSAQLAAGSFDGGKTCIQKLNIGTGDSPSLWGMFLIEQFFVVFDWDGARVGFANKGANGTVVATPTSTSTAPSTSAPTSRSTSSTGAAPSFQRNPMGTAAGLFSLLLMLRL